MTIKSLITVLDDPVQRVQAHACAALGNFFEGAEYHMVEPFMEVIIGKFSSLIQNGISIVKENAVTALAALAEAAKENFSKYFKDCIEFLTGYLMQFNDKAYKQFRGQVIEAITIIASSVGAETFKPYSPQVIKAMCEVQNTQLDSKDPQRTYLLSAWQRICLLLGKDFAPYLGEVIPGIF
jgi:vesicle coat complex subunit